MSKPTYYLSLLLLFTLGNLAVYGQSKGNISGKVSALSSKHPMEFVNIVLKAAKDSSVVVHEVTDGKGAFNLKAVPFGSYFLQASFIGFDDVKTPVFSLNGTKTFPLFMDDSKQTLHEVQVSARKAIFSNAIDRKVYQVDMDLMAKSGSASEVLQNVPLVQVDLNGNVSLRNSTATILINGKVSPLMGKNAAAVLQQLPANSIEKIEVITNPSAKYKPDGTGGIINIVLKKTTKRGWNGNLTGNIGNRERYNASSSFSYNPGRLNLFGSYSIRQDDRIRKTSNDRIQRDPETDATNNYHDQLESKTRPFSHIATLGIDYNIDDKNSFGLSGNYYLRSQYKNDLTVKTVSNSTGLTQDYDRKRKNSEEESNTSALLYFEHNFSKENHKLRMEFNIAHSPETENNHFTNSFRFPIQADQQDYTLIKQTADVKNLTLNYENPLSENSKLEAGYDGQFNKNDLDFYGAVFQPEDGAFVTDALKTNRFIYRERIHAFYSTFSHEQNKISVMVGLRAEYTDLNSALISAGTSIPNHYFKVYPTLHFSYKLNDHKELQLNYSRRVRRPEGDDLNPFAEYADPTNIRVGNPYLLPEIIHSVEAGYLWRKNGLSILPGIYYRYTYNRFTSITTPLNDSVLVTKQQNLANDRAMGADVVLSGNINSKLNLSLTPNIFYNQIDASNLGYSNKKSTITWSANFNTGYLISNTLSFQLNSIYKSSRLSPQGKFLPSFVMNAALRKDIFTKKGSIYLAGSDLFKTQRQEVDLQGPYLVQHVKTSSNSRMIYLGLSYNFGSTPKKKKDVQFDNSI
ncbi:TonB-dependent receptor domain-containing protein [Pedobacter gandavensis]|uniref:TonB-dependent receptor n=1 Tax=Pedobacter gandavensis TaxID=2679963 RepID=A0ABR6F265_9SPHI|nr:TonB-dependent receptor [Pedobacter gandavensis]MBB2151624.1 TonB-dependent receptor [Pedobacter gandavensis]